MLTAPQILDRNASGEEERKPQVSKIPDDVTSWFLLRTVHIILGLRLDGCWRSSGSVGHSDYGAGADRRERAAFGTCTYARDLRWRSLWDPTHWVISQLPRAVELDIVRKSNHEACKARSSKLNYMLMYGVFSCMMYSQREIRRTLLYPSRLCRRGLNYRNVFTCIRDPRREVQRAFLYFVFECLHWKGQCPLASFYPPDCIV